MTTIKRGVVNITAADKRLVTVDEVRQFDTRLSRTLTFAEVAAIHVRRLGTAHEGELGGWPEGYVVSTDAVAALALLADSLDHEAERMQEWARELRKNSCFLWWTRGPGVSNDG